MPRITLLLAAVLIALGVGSYVATGMASWTALIPAIVGLPFAPLGALAMRETLRKHVMHAAVALALLIFLGMAGMAGPKLPALLSGAPMDRPVAVAMQAVMGVLCGIYVGLGVKSFVAARRQRPADAAAQ